MDGLKHDFLLKIMQNNFKGGLHMKKSNRKRFGTFFLSLLLIFCLCAAPIQSAVVHAEEDVDVKENVEQPKDETADPLEIGGGGYSIF